MVQQDMFTIPKITPTAKATRCPCCDQTVKLYKIQMPTSALADLRELVKATEPDQYVHITNIRKWSTGGEFAKLKHWGLIVDQINENTQKRKSGMWTVTQKGRDFINGQILVRKYTKLYNQKFYGYDGGMVTLKEAMKDKFDYQELMSR